MSRQCAHSPNSWVYRVASHIDTDTFAGPDAFCSRWTCAREECIEAAKAEVRRLTGRTPIVNRGGGEA
jgi:hypothetical protein